MKTTVPTATHLLTGGLSDMYCAYTVNILPAFDAQYRNGRFLTFPPLLARSVGVSRSRGHKYNTSWYAELAAFQSEKSCFFADVQKNRGT